MMGDRRLNGKRRGGRSKNSPLNSDRGKRSGFTCFLVVSWSVAIAYPFFLFVFFPPLRFRSHLQSFPFPSSSSSSSRTTITVTRFNCSAKFSFHRRNPPPSARGIASRRMHEPDDAVLAEAENSPCTGHEHIVRTTFGPISVFVCGEQTKPPFITYPDVALNCLFCSHEATFLLLEHFCVYHIDPTCQPVGGVGLSAFQPMLTVDELVDQLVEILDFFGLDDVMCMGVTAGAYILTLFAIKYRERVIGLMLVSPLCQAPSWTEWFYNKLMTNLLYFYGMCNIVKEILLRRYFSPILRMSNNEESGIVQTFRRMLDERNVQNILRSLQAVHSRRDLTSSLKKLKCKTLIFVGEHSPFHHDALHMHREMDMKYSALVEVEDCGSLITEEMPHSMLIPMEYFLMGYRFYRPIQLLRCHSAPLCPLQPPCISAELLSPQSLGLKLKPIKTKIASS